MTNLILLPACTCQSNGIVPPMPLEAAILQAITYLEQHMGKAPTLAIALRVTLSESQTRRYLVEMEQRGLVKRIGTRGGWRVAA